MMYGFVLVLVVLSALPNQANSIRCYSWTGQTKKSGRPNQNCGNDGFCYWMKPIGMLSEAKQYDKEREHILSLTGGCIKRNIIQGEYKGAESKYKPDSARFSKGSCTKELSGRCQSAVLEVPVKALEVLSQEAYTYKVDTWLCCCDTQGCNTHHQVADRQMPGYPYTAAVGQPLHTMMLRCEGTFCGSEEEGDRGVCVQREDSEFECKTKTEGEEKYGLCHDESEETKWYPAALGANTVCRYDLNQKNVSVRTCCCFGAECKKSAVGFVPKPAEEPKCTTLTPTTIQSTTASTKDKATNIDSQKTATEPQSSPWLGAFIAMLVLALLLMLLLAVAIWWGLKQKRMAQQMGSSMSANQALPPPPGPDHNQNVAATSAGAPKTIPEREPNKQPKPKPHKSKRKKKPPPSVQESVNSELSDSSTMDENGDPVVMSMAVAPGYLPEVARQKI